MEEVRILGAGISGLSAAIILSKKGYRVTVYERAKESGSRFLGDLQGIENWSYGTNALEEIRGIGIETSFNYTSASKLLVTDGSNEVELKNAKEPFFYLVKRGTMQDSIDQSLKRQALDAGAEIEYSSTMKEEDVEIVATGPLSGAVFGEDKGIAFETDLDDIFVCLMDKELGTFGYSYLLVAGGYGCICSAVIPGSVSIAPHFSRTLKFFEEKYGLRMRNRRNVGGIATFTLKKRLKQPGRLFVGEAAGIQDFMLGFGMRSAMVSAYMAAREIADGESYESAVRERYEGYSKATVVDRYIWERSSGRATALIKSLRMEDTTSRMLRRAYTFGRGHRLLFPVAYRSMKKRYPRIFADPAKQ